MYEFHLYNQSNDGKTAAIRGHVDEIRKLASSCTGLDGGGSGRSLADYIVEADAASTDKPEPFFRSVDVLWRHPSIKVSPVYSQNRVFRVTYSGNIGPHGGVSFQGYCMVHPDWWPMVLSLHKTPIQIEYHTGQLRDLIVIVA